MKKGAKKLLENKINLKKNLSRVEIVELLGLKCEYLLSTSCPGANMMTRTHEMILLQFNCLDTWLQVGLRPNRFLQRQGTQTSLKVG